MGVEPIQYYVVNVKKLSMLSSSSSSSLPVNTVISIPAAQFKIVYLCEHTFIYMSDIQEF